MLIARPGTCVTHILPDGKVMLMECGFLVQAVQYFKDPQACAQLGFCAGGPLAAAASADTAAVSAF